MLQLWAHCFHTNTRLDSRLYRAPRKTNAKIKSTETSIGHLCNDFHSLFIVLFHESKGVVLLLTLGQQFVEVRVVSRQRAHVYFLQLSYRKNRVLST